MDELWLSIITGGFTIAGIMITNFFNLRSMNKSENLQRKSVIQEKKENLYLKVIKSLEMPLDNQFISLPKQDNFFEEEPFDIEAQMQLYAPSDILEKYHSAMDAREGVLPQQVIQKRNETLLKVMKKDLEIEER